MIRPATSIDRRGGVGRGNGELMMRAAPLRNILPSLYLVPPTRIVGDVLEDRTRYDIWISLLGANREAFQQAARDVITAAFHLSARKEIRDTDVYVLTEPNGKPPGLVEAVPMGGIFSSQSKGSLKLQGPLMSLATMIETRLGKPVIDETGIKEVFDIKLTYQEGVPGSLEDAVRALGLRLEPATRPIEFLSVTRRPDLLPAATGC